MAMERAGERGRGRWRTIELPSRGPNWLSKQKATERTNNDIALAFDERNVTPGRTSSAAVRATVPRTEAPRTTCPTTVDLPVSSGHWQVATVAYTRMAEVMNVCADPRRGIEYSWPARFSVYVNYWTSRLKRG